MSKDFCRVDYYDKTYEYLKNNTPVYAYVPFVPQPIIIDWRNNKLLKNNYYYQRIKRISKIPEGKKINHIYIKGENND